MKFSALIFLLLTSNSYAYETGSMSCEQLAQYAAASVHGKSNGTTYAKAVSMMKKTVPATYFIERRNMSEILDALYKQAWGVHLTEDGAYSAFKIECSGQ